MRPIALTGMELSSVEDLCAKLSSTQLQLGAVQRNYDAMSGAHLLVCISSACLAITMPHELHGTLQASWSPSSMRFSRFASAALLLIDASHRRNASGKPCSMQLMAELSGEQGSSADLLRRLEQAESKAAALEAKVQVLIRHGCCFVLLSDNRQTAYRSKRRPHVGS